MALDIKNFKVTWRGTWKDMTSYKRNDVVYWRGKSYRCIEDTPENSFTISSESMTNTSSYTHYAPTIVKRSYRPDNQRYWTLLLAGNDNIETWQYWRQYERGEMVKVADKIYLCLKRTRYQNTWVEEHDGQPSKYWELIYINENKWCTRNEVVSFVNRAPLGWRYNLGSNHGDDASMNYRTCVLCSDGSDMWYGAGESTSCSGLGDGVAGNVETAKFMSTGFTFTNWMQSTDNRTWNLSGTGRMTTHHGKAPRIIQVVGTYNRTYWLMDNGEVYAAGENGNYGLGNSETTDRQYTVRVTANDTTDWQGNNITKTFNQTKIVKIGMSDMHKNNGTSSMWALGDDGSIWVWGYNNNGQLGLGNPSINNSTDTTGGPTSTAFYSGNVTRPVRLPQSYFDGRMIVDVYWSGSEEAWTHALDEAGHLWAWGHNQHGELGVGNWNGTYYYTKPTRVGIDFNRYGGIKLLKHTWSNGSHHASFILDGEGYMWFTGYTTSGSVPFGSPGYTGTQYLGSWRRMSFAHNGDVDYFWCGGDEQKWFMFRQKSTGMLWNHDGNRHTYGNRGQSVESNGYDYHSGGMPGTFIHIKGPKWPVNVCDVGQDRLQGSSPYYQYHSPMILDDNGKIWGGGNNDDQGLGGTSQNDDQWTNGGRNSFSGAMEDNENFRTRKRIVFQPAGGHRWTDLFIGGHSGNSSMPAALNQRGQLYWTGYDGGSSATYQHDYYGEGANSNQESYFFHLGPRD